MNKEDYIGKYIALDCPSGALWAKVTGVVETNSMDGYSHSFVLEERKHCSGERIGRIKGKTLLECNLINESNVFNLEDMSEDNLDKIFLSALSSGKNNLSALELMPVEMIKEIITKGNKNENS